MFVVEADLPGVHQEDVDIQYDRNTLTISRTRVATLPSRDKRAQLGVFSAERLSGGLSRSMRVPQHVDADRITATFTHGVLTDTVPKASIAMPRKSAVTSPVESNAIDN